MKYTILVIDDELDEVTRADLKPRRPTYALFGEHFEIVYAESVAQIPSILNDRHVHAVILDFFLDRWRTDAMEVLRFIGERIPVCIVSAQWGPNFPRIRQMLDTYRNRAIAFYTWDELTRPTGRELLVMATKHAIAKNLDIAVVPWNSDEPIRILQLSDMQFGSIAPSNTELETTQLAQQVREVWRGPPTFIAITGDIAQHGLPNEYTNARNWLTKLAGELDKKWTPDRFLVVPGNHDICWPLGLSSQMEAPVGYRGDWPSLAELKDFALSPFRKFAADLISEEPWGGANQHWVLARFRKLGVVFFGYNSCEELDDKCVETRHLADPTLAQLFQTLAEAQAAENSPEKRPPLVIGLIHHPLCATNISGGVVNADDFYGALVKIRGTVISLCGHLHNAKRAWHAQDGASILEFVASTTSQPAEARSPDTTRGFNMIELKRENDEVIGVTFRSCRFESRRLIENEVFQYERDKRGRLQEL